jgi:hypothetical protein
MKKLNDSDLLTESRDYSNFFSWSVGQWAIRGKWLIYRNALVNHCNKTTKLEADPPRHVAKNYVPAMNSEILDECLNLGDVRELAEFEKPTMSNPDQIGGSVGRAVDVAPGALPRDLYAASLVTEALLFFVIAYFGAFLQEAMSSEGFPFPGTLFGAFSRSLWALLCLAAALFVPVLAAVGVAALSKDPFLWVEAGLVFAAFCSVVNALRRKSYWKGLNLLHRKKRKVSNSNNAPRPRAGESGEA